MAAGREETIRLQRIRDLYGVRGVPVLTLGVAGAVMALQAALWSLPYGDWRGALIWGGVVTATEAGVMGLIAAFHIRPRADQELRGWGLARAYAEGLRGVAWSLLALLTAAPQEPLSLLPIGITLVGFSAGVATGLAVHVPSMIAFVLGTLGPAAGFLLLRHGAQGFTAAAGMMGSSFLLVTLNGLRMSGFYRQLIEIRLDLAEQIEVQRRLQREADAARSEAETASAERTRFFGAASHDLRQPVHALGLYASLLHDDPPKAERRQLIARVSECVDSLERLFNAILTIARPMAEPREADDRSFPIQQAIERVLFQFQPQAAARGLILRAEATELWARGDEQAVERILANLVSNAVRYTESGDVRVRARRSGDVVRLVTADTGVGFPQTDAARIFDAFSQLRPAPGAGRQGFGLGLATVRELCRAHGFRCRVRSAPGRGSLFQVRLPAGTPQAAPARIEAPAPAVQGVRVLVAEDDPLVRDAVARLLRAWGVPFAEATSGEAAVAALAREPDAAWLVLLDQRLGGEETGLDIADRIRAADSRNIPIALVTGEADTALFDAAEQRGLTVLRKPLKPIRLRALLASAAGVTSGAAAA